MKKRNKDKSIRSNLVTNYYRLLDNNDNIENANKIDAKLAVALGE